MAKLNFIDSPAFMGGGIVKLIEKVPDDNKLFLKHLSKNDDVFELMKKKGQFLSEWFDDIEKLKLPISELRENILIMNELYQNLMIKNAMMYYI